MKVQLYGVRVKNPSSEIFREIGALARMIQTMSDVSFKSYHLQKGQFMFITRICENPGINHARLTQLMHIDKGTTTKAVQKLMTLGYIEKRQDGSDNRMQRLFPTDLANETYKKLIEKEESFITSAFSSFSVKEVELVTELVKEMRVNIENEWLAEKTKGIR